MYKTFVYTFFILCKNVHNFVEVKSVALQNVSFLEFDFGKCLEL